MKVSGRTRSSPLTSLVDLALLCTLLHSCQAPIIPFLSSSSIFRQRSLSTALNSTLDSQARLQYATVTVSRPASRYGNHKHPAHIRGSNLRERPPQHRGRLAIVRRGGQCKTPSLQSRPGLFYTLTPPCRLTLINSPSLPDTQTRQTRGNASESPRSVFVPSSLVATSRTMAPRTTGPLQSRHRPKTPTRQALKRQLQSATLENLLEMLAQA